MARTRKVTLTKEERQERYEKLKAARLNPVSLDESPDSFSCWSHIFRFIGSDEFVFVAPVSKRWHALYRELEGYEQKVIQGQPHRSGYHSRCLHPEPEVVGLTSRKAAFASASRVQLAHELGMPLGRDPADRMYDDSQFWCQCVIKHGTIESLEAALTLGMPLVGQMCEAAAKVGSVPKLSWLRSKGCRWAKPRSSDDHHAVSGIAAEEGHVNVLRFIKEQGMQFNRHTVSSGLRHMHVIEYFLAEGLGLPNYGSDSCGLAAADAARAGDMAALQYARSSGLRWSDADVGVAAAQSGSLEVLNRLADTLSLEWTAADLTAMLFRAGVHDRRAAAVWLLNRGAVWPDRSFKDTGSWTQWPRSFEAWAKRQGWVENMDPVFALVAP
jgi:hypothetical protein